MNWLANAARDLAPGYFALVMATGIVSIASDRAGFHTIGVILLGLMVSLAWDVRRQSSERLTKDLLRKLDVLMAQYVARHKQLPQVTPLIETRAAGHAAPQPTSRAGRVQTRPADEELPDEETLLTAAEMNNREVVMALRTDAMAAGAGPSPELFGPLTEEQPERGQGLGLYLLRRVAEAHGGRSWANILEGKGTTFYLELPAASPDGDTVRQSAMAGRSTA